jgi:hypothetical protein
MNLAPTQLELRNRFFHTLLEATLSLKEGPDPEVTLEMLLAAVGMLEQHLEQELAELRQEQAD